MSSRLPAALLLAACLFLTATASAPAAGAARSWSLRRSVVPGERYELALRFAGAKASDAVDVRCNCRLHRVLGPRGVRTGVLHMGLTPRSARVAIRARVVRGGMRLTGALLRRLDAAASNATSATFAAPAAPDLSATPATDDVQAAAPSGLDTPVSSAPAPEAPAASAPSAPAPAPRKLLFDDEFGGASGPLPDDSPWDPQWNFGWGPGQLQTYTGRPENVHLDGDGHLAIVARKETYTGPDGITAGYTSARLQTLGRFSFTYGRVEARIRLPAGQGLWPTFWTLGDDVDTKGWPECGEIDVMETIGSLPDQLNGTVHGPRGPWAGDPTVDGAEWNIGVAHDSPASLTSAFHVYAAEWTADAIALSLDGQVYSTVTKASLPAGARWTFDHPNHLLLNLAVGGEWPGAPTADTPFPATMLVDWVRVYAPAT